MQKKSAIILHKDQIEKNQKSGGYIHFPKRNADLFNDFVMENKELISGIVRNDDGSFKLYVDNDFLRGAIYDELIAMENKRDKDQAQYTEGQKKALENEEFRNSDENKEYFGKKWLRDGFKDKSEDALDYKMNLQKAVKNGDLTIEEAISLSTINNGELSTRLAELMVTGNPDEKVHTAPKVVITNPNTGFNKAMAGQMITTMEGKNSQAIYFRDYSSSPKVLSPEEVSACKSANLLYEERVASNLEFSLLSESNGQLLYPIDELEHRPETEDSREVNAKDRFVNNVELSINIILMQKMRERGITFVDGKLRFGEQKATDAMAKDNGQGL